MTILRFHRDAPPVVRLTAVLIVVGTVLEAAMTIGDRAPGAQSVRQLWGAWVSPAIGVSLGFMFGGGIARLVAWVYWLALLLWVPFVLIFTAMAIVQGLRQPAQGFSWSLVDVCGFGAMACYVLACALLLARPTRRAFESGT